MIQNIEDFGVLSARELPRQPKKIHANRGAFLAGPISMEWLAKAQSLGGSALAAGICLWFVRRVSGHDGPIRSSKAVRRKMGLSACQMLSGLRRLEAGSLVRFVKTGRGRCAVVEILTGPAMGASTLPSCGPPNRL
jgi:hypothetical protein